MLIRVHCPNPNCKKELRISAKHAGKKIACTGCGQKIRLPTAQDLKLPVAATTAPGPATEEPADSADDQVIDYVVSRYGEFVLLKPRLSSSTILLWGMPVALLVIGATVLAIQLRRRPARQQAEALSEDEAAKLKTILDEER